MASETPAKLIGIDSSKGTLQKGKDADILIIDKDISIRCVFSCGRIVEGMNTLVH
jgi:N-acetylglucosamine-6-phosphate deacetylase